MGLLSAPGLCTALLRRHLSTNPKLSKNIIFFLDDFLVIANSELEMIDLLDQLFTSLHDLGVYVSASKMQLVQPKITYLGVQLYGNRIEVPETRKHYFKTLPLPSTKAELASFLGAANFISGHIDSFHITTSLLTPLLSPARKFKLEPIQEKAIRQLYKEIDEAPSLYLVNHSIPLKLAVDGSHVGAGGICYQEINGTRFVVKYMSMKFDDALIRNEHSGLKEIASIVHFAQRNADLFAHPIPIIIMCDVRLMTHVLLNPQIKSTSRISRYAFKLFSLNAFFKLSWVGAKHPAIGFADLLSRQPHKHTLQKFFLFAQGRNPT
jgi:hypothetical protein